MLKSGQNPDMYVPKTRSFKTTPSYLCRNVSKYNQAFSDYPFPDDAPEFPHHSVMSKYVHDYVKKNGIDKLIRYNLEVVSIEKKGTLRPHPTLLTTRPGVRRSLLPSSRLASFRL